MTPARKKRRNNNRQDATVQKIADIITHQCSTRPGKGITNPECPKRNNRFSRHQDKLKQLLQDAIKDNPNFPHQFFFIITQCPASGLQIQRTTIQSLAQNPNCHPEVLAIINSMQTKRAKK